MTRPNNIFKGINSSTSPVEIGELMMIRNKKSSKNKRDKDYYLNKFKQGKLQPPPEYKSGSVKGYNQSLSQYINIIKRIKKDLELQLTKLDINLKKIIKQLSNSKELNKNEINNKIIFEERKSEELKKKLNEKINKVDELIKKSLSMMKDE